MGVYICGYNHYHWSYNPTFSWAQGVEQTKHTNIMGQQKNQGSFVFWILYVQSEQQKLRTPYQFTESKSSNQFVLSCLVPL